MTIPQLISYSTVKVFPLRSGRKQGCPLLPLLLNIAPEVLATAIRQEKKGIQIGKKELELSLFMDDTIYRKFVNTLPKHY